MARPYRIQSFIFICLLLTARTQTYAETGSNCGDFAAPCEPARIIGGVYDAGSAPISGAVVYGPWGLQTQTAADGTYELDIDMAAAIPLTVSSAGVQMYAATVTVDQGITVVRNFGTPPADTTPPDTSINSGPSGTVSSGNATFTFSCNESVCTFECALDGAPFSACNSPKAYSGLADGTHTFSVRASDGAGNTDSTPATSTWTVDTSTASGGGGSGGSGGSGADTTPPETTIDSGPTGTVNSGDASFAFSCNESACTFECALDGATFIACTSPQTYTGLADGSHTFSVRARDAAGNVDPTPATASWIVNVGATSDGGGNNASTEPTTEPPSDSTTSGPATETASRGGGGGCTAAGGVDTQADLSWSLLLFAPFWYQRRRRLA
ncbi:MAG: hypothetical protein D6761_09090 [Candidatus Dadabacteria bacterium]|nr:MAG: hypothetical protein D6761_09090 [Candidatus Dadabacteria bacterium]